MKHTKDHIQKTLDSLDGIQRAEMSPLAAERIWQKANNGNLKTKVEKEGFSVPIAWISGLAAVVILNIAFLTLMSEAKQDDYDDKTTVSSLYFDTEIGY